MRKYYFSGSPHALFFVALSSVPVWTLSRLRILSDQLVFALVTIIIIIYLYLELRSLRSARPARWLLNPIVLCSFITFGMSYGFSNVVFLFSPDQLALLDLVPEVSPAMVSVMWLALLSAVAMWMGYWSPVAVHWTGPQMVRYFGERFLPDSNELRSVTLPALLAVAATVRLVQIKLGVFGYSSNYDRLIELGSITQYLSLASGLGSLALVLASLQLYGQPPVARKFTWFIAALSNELIFGLLSGFKSALVLPFLIAAICQYLRVGRVSKYWPLLAVAGVLVGYAVIEPFRVARNLDLDFSGTSLVEIVRTLSGSVGDASAAAVESAPLILAVASRVNLSYIASFGVDFADANPSLPDGSPEFLQNILLAPLHAWIPRLIWESKPLGNLGLWYNQVVMEKDHFSSTAMGPLDYLYFAGGPVAVFLGFFFVGIVQRCLYFLLQPRTSTAGAVIFLALLYPIIQIDSAFNGLIITLCRDFPLVIMLQFLIFKSRVSGRAIDGRVSDDPAVGLRSRVPAEPAMPLVTGGLP
jgi:hypothetical protein